MKYYWQATTDNAEEYLTTICLCLSITASIMTVAIYCLDFSTLSTADKNFVCICVILIFCDTTQLAAGEAGSWGAWCKVIAILLHAGYLALTMWTALIAIDLYKTFCKLSPSNTMNDWPVRNAFTVAFIDGTVILVCILIDHVVQDCMMYGKGGICWIGNSTARICGYIAPATVIYTGSTVLLVYVAYKMKQNAMSELDTDNDAQNNRAKLSIVVLKIIFILGIPEIIGIIQLQPTNEIYSIANAVIKLLYTTIRSLHGVFIFICLVLTSKRSMSTTRGFLHRYCSNKNVGNTEHANTSIDQSCQKKSPSTSSGNAKRIVNKINDK